MFDRPRCRDWSPLSTQQLRLRSLIQISGHNIVCDHLKCSVYFTLHTTTMSAPFYTSEKLDVHNNIIWPEINCPMALKSSLRCVCVRVWQHNPRINAAEAVPQADDPGGSSEQQDKLLFLWGVYFSGLVPLTRRSEKRLKENTLVFQMHGGYFTSAEHILDREEQISQSSSSVPKIKTPTASNKDGFHLSLLSDKNELLCDNSNNSPPSWYSPSSALDVECKISKLGIGYSPSSTSGRQTTRSSSPDEQSYFMIRTTVSPTPTEIETNLKIRYLFMEFFKSEVRPSYDVKRLLAVQERQRRIKYESEGAKELIDRICMKSAYCLNLELFSDKQLVYRSSVSSSQNRSGMGKQLSRLLYQEREPLKPEILLKAQELRRQIEQARFRCRTLTQERERIRGSVRQLQQKLHQMTDANIEAESALMDSYRNYGKEKEVLYQQKLAYASEKQCFRDLREKVLTARHRLLRGLNEIYCIEKRNNGTCTINGIPLPNAESYTETTPALELSVALGYVAHVTVMCSSILNIPLRNPIKYEGSRSKMVDCIKVLPTTVREFPLYCRSGAVSNALLYAVFLLNQNISQLKYYLGLSRGDPRATLANLHDILTIPSIIVTNRTIEDPFQAIPTNISGSSSVELDVPDAFSQYQDLKESRSISRISRSVDTYSDSSKEVGKRNGRFASDPILAQGQMQVSGFERNVNF